MSSRDHAPDAPATAELRVDAVEALSDGVAVVRSSDLVVVTTNPGWRRLFATDGRLPEVLDVVGSEADLGELVTDLRRGLDQHLVWRRTVSVRDRAGRMLDCRLSVSPAFHPVHRAVWVVGATDVSAEIDGRRRLQETVAQLRAEVADLRARSEARHRRLQVVTHELRTPIAAITGQVELLQHGSSTRTTDQIQEQIHVSLADLAALVDGVLPDDDRRDPAPRRLGLRLELDGVLLRTRSLLRSRRLSVVVPADVEVVADDAVLSEVLEHLLLTVVKYSAPGGDLAIEVVQGHRGAVRLEIHDRSRGVAASSLDAVAVGHGFGGGALQHFVESGQGGFGVASSAGAGATFWIELPAP